MKGMLEEAAPYTVAVCVYRDGHPPDTSKMPRLTDAVIKRLPLPTKGNRVHYDEIGGFGVRVTAGGARSFVLNYVTRTGRERRLTLGGFPNWTVAMPREAGTSGGGAR